MILIYQPPYLNKDLYPRWLQAVLERGNPVGCNHTSVEPVLLVDDCQLWQKRRVTIITGRRVEWIVVNLTMKVRRESKFLVTNYCKFSLWMISDSVAMLTRIVTVTSLYDYSSVL